MPEQVAIFIDFQNVHLTGHGLFSAGVEPYRCVPDPSRVADLIASRRQRPSEALAIRVYRGRPDPNHQPMPTAANDAQAAQWARDRRVQVIRRQLNYRNWPTMPPQEKGIDVALAVDMIHLALRHQYDAVVLFSSDTDLLPALETVVNLRLGHVEVACWSGFKPLRFSGTNRPWCHFLSEQDWLGVVDDWQGRV
jgi:uncharacterized LabA/DUF88 family protein